MFSGQDLKSAEELVEAIWFFNKKGWSPATSTNYSIRSSNPNEYIISRSGVDKSVFTLSDLLLINQKGDILQPFARTGVKKTAETELHTAIYARFPEARCILHTHSVLGTVLSYRLAGEGEVLFEGLEIIKGLEGNETHDMTEIIPIVPNSQHMPDIIRNLESHFKKNSSVHGFLIAGHGLYTWGKDVAAAKRHVEALEFLFECFHTMRRL